MLRNYLLIAYRNLLRHKVFSTINIAGLAIGMAACLVILHYVQFEWSYDRFHKKGDQVYRVRMDKYKEGKLEFENAYSDFALGKSLLTAFPEIEDVFRLHSSVPEYIFSYKDHPHQPKVFNEERVFFADEAILSNLSLPLVMGDLKSALGSPHQVIISESTALKYFGEDWRNEEEAHPIGKELQYHADGNTMTLVVKGVFQDIPKNSHLQFDFLISFHTLYFIYKPPHVDQSDVLEGMWGYPQAYTYLVLRDKADPEEMEMKITEWVQNHAVAGQDKNSKSVFYLQPITKIHLHSNLLNEPGINGNAQMVYLLAGIAFFILLIAYINYINLTTARSLQRAKEIGIRKLNGASRWQLMKQFLTESFLLNGLSLLIGVTIAQFSLPLFTYLTKLSLHNNLLNYFWFWSGLMIIFIVGALLSGAYPAFILSSSNRIHIFKPTYNNIVQKGAFRKGLLVFQLVSAVVVLAGTYVVFSQIHFMQRQPVGVNIQQALVIKSPQVLVDDQPFNQALEKFRNELSSFAFVESVTASTFVPGHGKLWSRGVNRPGEKPNEINDISVDSEYLASIGAEFIAGTNFSENPENNQNKLILNEAALELLGFSSLSEAINKKIQAWGEYEIIGIVKNFHQTSMKNTFEPIAFYNEMRSGYYLVNLKVNIESARDFSASLSTISQTYQTLFPENPFNYFFLDDFYESQYLADRQFGQVFGLFSGMAIFVACLGLWGLAFFAATQRIKEIGVRKVLGASNLMIMLLLNKDFLKLIIIAIVIAFPVAYWTMDSWLQNYAFRIDINYRFFIFPSITVMAIAFITVSFQTWKAANTDPVKSLKYE